MFLVSFVLVVLFGLFREALSCVCLSSWEEAVGTVGGAVGSDGTEDPVEGLILRCVGYELKVA